MVSWQKSSNDKIPFFCPITSQAFKNSSLFEMSLDWSWLTLFCIDNFFRSKHSLNRASVWSNWIIVCFISLIDSAVSSIYYFSGLVTILFRKEILFYLLIIFSNLCWFLRCLCICFCWLVNWEYLWLSLLDSMGGSWWSLSVSKIVVVFICSLEFWRESLA